MTLPVAVVSSPTNTLLREEADKLWKKIHKKMGKLSLPGLVIDIIAECEQLNLWQVDTVLPLLTSHVSALDRRMESERRETLRKKVEEEQHFFWQIAREKKARPPPLLKKGNDIISDPWDILGNMHIFWGSIYNSPAVFDEIEFRHRYRVALAK